MPCLPLFPLDCGVVLDRGSPSDQSYLTAARKLISDMGDPKNGLFNAQAEVRASLTRAYFPPNGPG